MQSYKHILVPTDGSKLSLKAAKEAATLAKSLKAKMTALYVIAPYMPTLDAEGSINTRHGYDQKAYEAASSKFAGEATAKIAATAAQANVKCQEVHVTDPAPWDGIIRAAAKNKCDLIVMSSHGRGNLAGLLLGSETTKVLAHSKTPVLVCR